MGAAKERRAVFFAAHPKCCFCGGGQDAVEIDHIPARALFEKRHGPVGYEFPACEACNDESRLDEALLTWLARIKVDEYTPLEAQEAGTALMHLNRRRPEMVRALRQMSRNEVRNLAREHGMGMVGPDGNERYAFQFPDEHKQAIDRYAAKLGKAIYYLHNKQIFPLSGTMKTRVFTNVNLASQHFPTSEMHQILKSRPVVTRNGRDLSDQFSYRYAIAKDSPTIAFLAIFRQSFGMLVILVPGSLKTATIPPPPHPHDAAPD